MKRQIHTLHSYGRKLLKISPVSAYPSDFQNYLNLSIKNNPELKNEILQYFLQHANFYKSPFD